MSPKSVAGRYRDRYMAFTTRQCIFSNASLGTVHIPGHPVVAGVTSFQVDGLYTGNRHHTLRSPCCECIAEFSPAPYCLAAAFDSAGIRTASIGFCPTSNLYGYRVQGHWVRMLVNALEWVMVSGGVAEEAGAEALSTAPDLKVVPNPAARAAAISYTLPGPGMVSLKLYNVTGALAATLVRGPCAAGRHTVRIERAGLARGTYVLRLDTEAGSTTRKLTLE
ncbi:T9SS type A sorting domain-containing protein [candidate division WOR-3 bacterium]|nr:T9SS type A sorting domain-containing protein [candidate division WOR-3 bacterium]